VLGRRLSRGVRLRERKDRENENKTPNLLNPGYNTIDSANQLESIQYFVVCYIKCNARDTAFSPHYLWKQVIAQKRRSNWYDIAFFQLF
jgi:hypothetical protein